MRSLFVVLSLSSVMTGGAWAQPPVTATLLTTPPFADAPPLLPEPVRQMLEAALASGNDADIATVARLATKTNPKASAEIASLVQEHAKAREVARLERLRQANAVQLWTGKVELGGFVSSGSSDEVGISAAVALKRQGIRWSHAIAAAIDYRRANGVTSREQIIASYQPRYQFNRGFAYMLAQYERDPFTGFDARYTGSAGIGYKLVQSKPLDLAVDIGPSIRHVGYIDDTAETRAGVRSSVDLGWRISPDLTFRQTAAGHIESKTRSLNAQTSLNSRIMSRLTASVSYTVQYETETRLTSEKLDSLSKLSLIYDF